MKAYLAHDSSRACRLQRHGLPVHLASASCIGAFLSVRSQGLREKAGLATAVVLTFVGTLIWLFVPPKPDSEGSASGRSARRASSRTSSVGRRRYLPLRCQRRPPQAIDAFAQRHATLTATTRRR